MVYRKNKMNPEQSIYAKRIPYIFKLFPHKIGVKYFFSTSRRSKRGDSRETAARDRREREQHSQ